MMIPAKLYEKKAPKKGREKEIRGKHQSPGKQTTQKRYRTATRVENCHKEEREPLRTGPRTLNPKP
jgi:hypothetical protein